MWEWRQNRCPYQEWMLVIQYGPSSLFTLRSLTTDVVLWEGENFDVYIDSSFTPLLFLSSKNLFSLIFTFSYIIFALFAHKLECLQPFEKFKVFWNTDIFLV
jgi:hypothetical protein